MDKQSLKSTITQSLRKDKVQFILAFVLTVLLASAILFVATGGFQTDETVPEPPEDKNSYHLTYQQYTTVEFSYAYNGPEDPPTEVVEESEDESQEKIVPIRAIVHETDKITKDTILHEFDPHSRQKQKYTVDLTELAEDPDDPLRTHQGVHLSLVYSNGAIEKVGSVSNTDIESQLSANYETIPSSPELARFRLMNIQGERVVVETANRTEVIEDTSSAKKFSFGPEDYYTDTTGDGIYDTAEPINAYVTYNDKIRNKVYTTTPSYRAPSYSIRDSNKEGHKVILFEGLDEPIAVYTPSGEYIVNEYRYKSSDEIQGDGSYIQMMEFKGEKIPTVTVSEEAETVKILINKDGTLYVAEDVEI